MARTHQVALVVSTIAMLAASSLQLYSAHKQEIRAAEQKEKLEGLRKQILELELDLQKRKGIR